MTNSIDFYFDFYSPYGYLASLRIDEIAARHGCRVNWRPFMLGATFSITGHKPLTETPMMAEYTLLDLERSARLQSANFRLPDDFPKAALSCCRAFYLLVDDQPEQAVALAKAIYAAIFGEGRDGTDIVLIAELAANLEIDAEALVEGIQTQSIKDRLKAETQAAIDRGVFGSPFIFVGDQPFWGNDRLEQVDRWLDTGGW
jgi:2-hydroxychromene-2-carboxylate isomerase